MKKKLEGLFLPTWLAGGVVPGYRALAATRKVRSGLAGGWCATTFVDTTPEAMFATFADMYTTTGFTDRKLRVRF